MSQALPLPSDFDEAERELLAGILREPLVVRALSAVVNDVAPDPRKVAAMPPHQQAALANVQASYRGFVRDLERIASPTKHLPDPTGSDLGEWTHLEGDEPSA